MSNSTKNASSDPDNQQRRLESRLSWLGGIIDGEGMVTTIKRVGGKYNQYGYSPRISIVNTDLVIINEVVSICDEISLPYYVQTKKGKGLWKTKYEVLFNGMRRCKIVLDVITPYLVSKKQRAISLLKFCNNRLNLPRNSSYSESDLKLAQSIRVRI